MAGTVSQAVHPSPVRIERWMRQQASFFLPYLAAAGAFAPELFLAVPPLVLLGHAMLWRVLGAGRFAADFVTGARVVLLVAGVAAALWTGTWNAVAWGTCVVAACMDLIDGAVARRCGASPGGAVLDMEADQASFVVFASLACAFDLAPTIVLVLPAMRFGYVLLMWVVGCAVHDPKPLDGDNRRAKVICAVVVVLQLVFLAPFVRPDLRAVAAYVAIALLVPSYVGDVRGILRRRP